MASELAYLHGSIALAERDIAYIDDWIRAHPNDDHVPDYRRIRAIDEGTLRRARKRSDALERRLMRIQRRERGPGGAAILTRFGLARKSAPSNPPRSTDSR